MLDVLQDDSEEHDIDLGGEDLQVKHWSSIPKVINVDQDVSITSYKYDSRKDKEGGEYKSEESVNFMTVFEYNDCSFLLVICICNFAQGFRRLLELGLYFVFKDKLGL